MHRLSDFRQARRLRLFDRSRLALLALWLLYRTAHPIKRLLILHGLVTLGYLAAFPPPPETPAVALPLAFMAGWATTVTLYALAGRLTSGLRLGR